MVSSMDRVLLSVEMEISNGSSTLAMKKCFGEVILAFLSNPSLSLAIRSSSVNFPHCGCDFSVRSNFSVQNPASCNSKQIFFKDERLMTEMGGSLPSGLVQKSRRGRDTSNCSLRERTKPCRPLKQIITQRRSLWPTRGIEERLRLPTTSTGWRSKVLEEAQHEIPSHNELEDS